LRSWSRFFGSSFAVALFTAALPNGSCVNKQAMPKFLLIYTKNHNSKPLGACLGTWFKKQASILILIQIITTGL